MPELRMKQGEEKIFGFLIKRNGTALDLSAISPPPEFKFGVKSEREDVEYEFRILNTDFITIDWDQGIVKINIGATEIGSMESGSYVSELKTTLASDDIDKSDIIDFILEKSVIHD